MSQTKESTLKVAPAPWPPGPRALPYFGNIFEYVRDPLAFFERLAREFGDIASMRFFNLDELVLSHPDDIEAIFVHRPNRYVKEVMYRALGDVLGQGLLTSEGDFWRRQRQLINPAFHRARVGRYAQAMVECAERAMAGWQTGQVLVMDHEMAHLTLDIAVRTLFGSDVSAQVAAVRRCFSVVGHFFEHPFAVLLVSEKWRWVWTPAKLRYRRAANELDRVVRGIIASRQRESGGDDLLAELLAARDDAGRGMSETQIRDEVITLLLAGHETTALSLTYTWHLLARHPEVEANLADELQAVLGGRTPTLEDLPRLPYTEQIVKESLRLYPPAFAIAREATEPDEIRGIPIPVGTAIGTSQWVVHRDPRWYESPLSFRPERWTPEFEKGLPRLAYFPFGAGQRMCVGAAFAMIEARLALATIAQRYRFQIAGSQELRFAPSITLRPRDPVRMVAHSR